VRQGGSTEAAVLQCAIETRFNPVGVRTRLHESAIPRLHLDKALLREWRQDSVHNARSLKMEAQIDTRGQWLVGDNSIVRRAVYRFHPQGLRSPT
jgi:hypothetical protein